MAAPAESQPPGLGRHTDGEVQTLLIRDHVKIRRVHCRSIKCTSECWVAKLSQEDNQMGASIRQSLVRYKRRCSKAVRKISAVGKNFLNVDRGNCHALVTWTFQGKSYESMALLDTGSQACIINIKVARELGISDDDIQKSNILLKAASGTGLQMYGTVDIDVTLAGTKIRHKIFVVKDRLLILCQDLLTKIEGCPLFVRRKGRDRCFN